jgi:acetyl esterase/lipase
MRRRSPGGPKFLDPLRVDIRYTVAITLCALALTGGRATGLILVGESDDWTPAAPCRRFTQSAKAAGTSVTIASYPNATHAFNVDLPDREAGVIA